MLLELESIWDKLKYAMEKDSLNRQSATVMTNKKGFMKKYMEFI
jgi:hypothetical protein